MRIDHVFNALLPGCIKVDAGNTRKNIDGMWLPSKPKKVIRLCQILHADVLQRSAKRSQRLVSRPCVFYIRPYEKIDVPGKAGLRVKDDRVTPTINI